MNFNYFINFEHKVESLYCERGANYTDISELFAARLSKKTSERCRKVV